MAGVRKFRLPRLAAASDEMLHLDLLRFLAAMTVVVYHFRNQAMFGQVAGEDIGWFENLSLAVDLFFVISGIVITFAYERLTDATGFMRKRFARLAPLHYATLLFYLVVGYANTKTGGGWVEAWKYRPHCLPGNLLFLQAFGTCDRYSFNHVSWSVSAEMAVYLLFLLILPLYRRSPAIPLAMSLVWLAIAYLAGPIGPEHRAWDELTYDFGIVRAVPGFLFGMALWGYRDRLARLPYPRGGLVVVALLFFAGIAAGWPRGALVPIVYLLAAMGLATDRAGPVAPWVVRIAPLGTLTYGIYMLHPLVRTVGWTVLRKLGLSSTAAIALCFVAVIPVAYIIYFTFEQPLRRWLSPRRRPVLARAGE